MPEALVALLDASDPSHLRCIRAGRTLAAGPLETTWPCFTEAMYLLGSVGGYRYQERVCAPSDSVEFV